MVTISDEDYAELEFLRRQYGRDAIGRSIKSITRLVDDTDSPIRECVAALALLGCEPLWSCCGYDYEGQPIHKDHAYGTPYVAVAKNDRSMFVHRILGQTPFPFSDRWGLFETRRDGVDICGFKCRIVRDGYWESHKSPHFGELGATYLQYFRDFLFTLSDHFSPSAVIVDTNGAYRNRFPFWQYPAKEAWTVTKDALLLGEYGAESTRNSGPGEVVKTHSARRR